MSNRPEKTTSALIDKFIALRKEHGLSHDQLAEKTGLSRAAISFIESKKRTPSILTCLKIANALGSKLSDLLEE